MWRVLVAAVLLDVARAAKYSQTINVRAQRPPTTRSTPRTQVYNSDAMYMPYLLMGSCYYDINVQAQQYAVVVQLLDEVEYAALTVIAHTQWHANPTYAQIQGMDVAKDV